MLDFGNPNDRYYMHGIDRGVAYVKGNPVVWNGLTGVDESSDASRTVYYRDGIIYLAEVDPGDFEGSMTSLFFPDELSECLGMPEVADGLYVDNQKPKRFNLSYRTLIGSGLSGDMFGYQIHLIYNVVAQIGTLSRRSMNESADMTEMNFDLTATPVKLPGLRPSAHYVIDTRHLGASTIAQLEEILYGNDSAVGRMPLPEELYDIMNFGDSITFIDHGNGTWTARGSRANVHMTGEYTWEILNVNGTDHGDGTYTLVDTVGGE